MLTKIAVKDKTFSLWKPKDCTDETVWVEPGEYYCLRGSIKKEYRETFKQRMAPLACNDPNGVFCWLMPYERWVKDVYDGRIYKKPYEVEDTEDNRAELAKALDVDVKLVGELRTWQRSLLLEHEVEKDSGTDFRRAAIVRVGGGKTLFGLLLGSRYSNPVVLAPAYVHRSWIDEADKWGLKCPKLSTYQSAHKVGKCDCLILDEVLLVANPMTVVHGNALKLSQNARCVVGLTGTPQSTSPMDMRWLRCIYPGSVPAEEKPWRFLFGKDTELVEVKPGTQSYVTKEWDHDTINKFISPYVLMVKPEEIVRELPEITYQRITVPQPEQYKLILKGAATERGKSKALAQARMCTDGKITDDNGRILAELNTAKCDAICQYLTGIGEPAVVFARWDYMVQGLAARLRSQLLSRGTSNGNTNDVSVLCGGADYDTEIAKFRDGRSQYLVANSGISQGMNLQERARVVIFASWSTKPTDREQAIGRVYRPGQKHGVIVVDVVAENTLDETTVALLDKHKDRNESFIEAALAAEFKRQCRG